MPTQLPNGILIVNVTPHELNFYCEEKGQFVTAPSDGLVNAFARTSIVQSASTHDLVSVKFSEMRDGRFEINRLKRLYPDALIVGSVIAAQAYQEDVVCTIPCRVGKPGRYVKCNRFTVYPKEITNG